MFNTIIATYRKNHMCIKRAQPWSMYFSRVTGGFFTILFSYVIYFYFSNGELSNSFNSYSMDMSYMAYIVSGTMFNILAVSTLMNVGRSFILELREGTLEPFLLSPASRSGYLIGCLLEQTVRALVECAIVVIFGFLLGADLNNLLSFKSIFVIIISVISFFSLAVVLGAVMLYTRDTYITQNTLFAIMTFICGISFPIEYLPLPIQHISQLLPLTPAVKLFRTVVINGQTIIGNLLLVKQMLFLSIVYFFIGYFSIKAIEKKVLDNIFG